MFPSSMEPTLIKEDDTVTWKAESFKNCQQKRVCKKENCKDQGLKNCNNRQIDQWHKIERLKIILK